MTDSQLLTAQLVQSECAKDPKFFKHVIDTSLAGVKEYAETQTDKASKLAFILMDLLTFSDIKPAHFTKKEILDSIRPWFEGTKAFEDLRKQNG